MKQTTSRSAVGAVLTMAVSAVLLPVSTANAAPAPRTADSATTKTFATLADAVLTQRTAALLDGRSARSTPAKPGNIRLSAALSRTEDTGLSTLRTRKARLASLGEAYTSGDTRVSVDTTSVKGGRATVRVTEVTTLTYKKIRGDEPSTTGFRAHHELNFTSTSKGKWELTGIRPTDSGPRPINEPRTAVATTNTGGGLDGTPASTSWPARPQPKTRGTAGYNYAAMAAYAEKYWRNYNPAYRKFNDQGGDCTNFISQALRAGGWKNDSGSATDYRNWWYDNTTQTTSWVGANEWAWFTLSSKRAVNLANVYQMDVGDILQMDFDRDGSKDHSMMTTYRSRAGVPYLTYHSTNTYRKSVASIIASNPGAVYFAYRT
ncbi:amidase domain-containing protein [Streptomyces albireticuli]|nr:amidase domain-containing protein [Streptomyces albireticuli]MCD9145087.1 amidase domain-containing protein [Streptomyces albireticuli]MCD9164513.1 amidase domain-containing protein [Streptomyces albireticuli]MCD9194224.1 amidase domain-containing protein [Streptomyces albireticuli]